MRLVDDWANGDDGVVFWGDCEAFASISMKIERDCLPRPNKLMTWVKEKLQQYSAILHFHIIQTRVLFFPFGRILGSIQRWPNGMRFDAICFFCCPSHFIHTNVCAYE